PRRHRQGSHGDEEGGPGHRRDHHHRGTDEGRRVSERPLRPGSGGVITMDGKRMTRRRLLAAAAGLGAGLTVPGALWAGGPDEAAPLDAAAARQRLLDGNKRFVAGESIHSHASREWRRKLTAGQKPFATILSCSDSRVPPELVFDQGFGDLFVIRIAGNVIS